MQIRYPVIWYSRACFTCYHCCFSHSAYWFQPETNYFIRCSQPRLGSTEQGKENKKRRLAAHSLPQPRCLYGRNTTEIAHGAYNKAKKNRRPESTTSRIIMPRCYAGFGPSRARTRFLSAHQLGQLVSLHRFYASVCDNNFPSPVASQLS